MKSFKKHIAEVAQPKSPEEKAFKDQHSYETKSHPVAPDAVFTGEITGKSKKPRIADVKDDEKVYDKATPKKKDDGVTLESTEQDRARYDAADDKDKKKVTLPTAPWDKKKKEEELVGGQKKLDHNKNGKIDGHDLAMLRSKKKKNEAYDEPQGQAKRIMSPLQKARIEKEKADRDSEGKLKETTSSALTKMVTQTGPDGKTRTVQKKAKADRTDDQGQDIIGEISKGLAGRYIKKAQVSTADAAHSTERGATDARSPDVDIRKAGDKQRKKGIKDFVNRNKGTSTAVDKLTGKAKVAATEEVEQIDEAVRFKKGPLRLKNGKQVMVSDEDAKLLTKMFKDLNPRNQKAMHKVMLLDPAGFEEIRGFAREAL